MIAWRRETTALNVSCKQFSIPESNQDARKTRRRDCRRLCAPRFVSIRRSRPWHRRQRHLHPLSDEGEYICPLCTVYGLDQDEVKRLVAEGFKMCDRNKEDEGYEVKISAFKVSTGTLDCPSCLVLIMAILHRS